MAAGRTPLTGTQFTAADFAAAKLEPVVLAPQASTQWIAPQFIWQVRRELSDQLCGAGVDTCPMIRLVAVSMTVTVSSPLLDT